MPKRDDIYMRRQRERILEAAHRCFLKSGPSETSMAAISQGAGLSMGALYTHFACKADIVLGVIEYTWAKLRRSSVVETWQDFEREYLSRLGGMEPRDELRLNLQFLALALSDPEYAKAMRRSGELNAEVLQEVLEALKANGEIDPPGGVPTAARLLGPLLGGTTLYSIMQPTAHASAATIRDVRKVVHEMLVPKVTRARVRKASSR